MIHSITMQVLQSIPPKPPKHFLGGKTKRQFARRWNRTKYTYNATTNRLTSIDDSYDNADYAFSYDSLGNVTHNGNQGFTYNLAGNMTSSTNPGITYKYDGHKRRVQKDDGSQIGYTVYGQNGKLMHKLKGGVSTHYVYAGSLLIAELQGSTVNYVHTDLLGSPIKGDNGTAYAEHYRPWGEKKDHPIQLADDVGYTSHQDDVATGLTYMQARYYDPVVGRFMATDPASYSPRSSMTFGRFLYANSNPYRYMDPDGREVHAVFDKSSGTITVTDNDTQQSAIAPAFSGEPGDYAAAPNGNYYISDFPWGRSGEDHYFALVHDDEILDDVVDGTPSNYVEGEDMSSVRLHAGFVSHACVTVPSSPDDNPWMAIQEILENTRLGDPIRIGGEEFPNFGKLEIDGEGHGDVPE